MGRKTQKKEADRLAEVQRIRHSFAAARKREKTRSKSLWKRASQELTDADSRFFRDLLAKCDRTRLLEDGPVFPQYGTDTHNTFRAALVRISLFHIFAIRDLANWSCRSRNANRQFSSLVRHLFAEYLVPQFMDSIWFRPSYEWVEWFIDVGQGMNIRKVQKFPAPYTKAMAYHMMSVPPGFTIEEAMRYGRILGLGGNERQFRAILATRLPATTVFYPAKHLFRKKQDFWQSVIAWFIHYPMLDTAMYGPIVDYIEYCKYEPVGQVLEDGRWIQRGPRNPRFSMKGRNPESLLRRVEEWHGALGRRKGVDLVCWPSSKRDWTYELTRKGQLLRWQIREITNSVDLTEEGRTMRHCVFSYMDSCRQRRCAIFSLRENGKRVLTVELTATGLGAVRGKANRLPTKGERNLLQRWLKETNLQPQATIL